MRSSGRKTLIVEYAGNLPQLCAGMELSEAREGRLTVFINPSVCPVSKAVSHISEQTEISDISVSGISAEEMVAGLYREYKI